MALGYTTKGAEASGVIRADMGEASMPCRSDSTAKGRSAISRKRACCF